MVDAAQASIALGTLVAAAALASLAFAFYSWRYVDHPVSNRFAMLMGVDGVWAGFYFLQLVGPTDRLATVWMPFETTSSALAAALWFLFVIEYTGDSDWIPEVVEPLVVGHAFVYGGLYVLNPGGIAVPEVTVSRFGFLRLPHETFGPVVLAEIAFVYALLLTSFVLLGRFFLDTRNLYRRQTGIILAVTASVVLANAVYLSGFSPHPHLDLTTVFFVVQAVGVGVALYRYDFLNVTPLAASTLLQEMTDPVFVVDNRDRIVDYNGAAAAYVRDGATRPHISSVDIREFEHVLGVRDGGGVDGVEVMATRGDGDSVAATTYDVRTTPLRDQYGEVRGEVVVLRDVTEREARKRALENQNRRLEEFASVVSHDLRNPLQVVDGSVQLARETGDIAHLDRAQSSIERMETLIDELLVLAREGQTIDETEPVDLASLSRAAWQAVDSGDCTLDVDTQITVTADSSRLQQALENLFRNAVEHGGSHVTVGDCAGGFFVADDGPGIPPEDREAVFELGYTTAGDGTGFGLGIVKRVVEAHGWSIAVTESDAGGARFEVTDPDPLEDG